RGEIEQRIAQGKGPITPEGDMAEERYRLVVEGPPNWTSFREFWKMFADEGAVVVSCSYTKVGGIYDNAFRHDPARPLESLEDLRSIEREARERGADLALYACSPARVEREMPELWARLQDRRVYQEGPLVKGLEEFWTYRIFFFERRKSTPRMVK
ncbi:MAG: hypothetical protein ACC661_11275, partial [Verrucomicrobiales bacterium]